MLTGGAATQTTAGTYAVTADFVPTDTTNYNTLIGLSAGNFVIAEGDADGDAGGEQLAADLHRRAARRRRSASRPARCLAR